MWTDSIRVRTVGPIQVFRVMHSQQTRSYMYDLYLNPSVTWMVLCTSGPTLKIITFQKTFFYFCTNEPSHGGLVQSCSVVAYTEES